MNIESHLYQTAVEHATVDALDWEESIQASANEFVSRPSKYDHEKNGVRRFADHFVHDRNKRIHMFQERERIVLLYSLGIISEQDATRRLIPIELSGRHVAEFGRSFMSTKQIVTSRAQMYKAIMDKFGLSIPFDEGLVMTFQTVDAFKDMYQNIIKHHFEAYARSLRETRCPTRDASCQIYQRAALNFLDRKVEEFSSIESAHERI
ncbi:MAG TPA: hypothetical protein VK158_03840 [Acidobacteriota bacterium]|nr:hypothetical protein [Acidobacteriota bacterium]